MTQSNQSSKQSGKTLVGLVLGLIIGLAIAVIVALYITRGPTPLVSKYPSTNEKVDTSPANQLAPNKQGIAPPAARAREDEQLDDSQIIELPKEGRKTPKNAASNTRSPAASSTPSATPSEAANLGYFLQVGAYKTDTGAEQQRAHLALQGFESKVSQRTSGDLTYYRVRVGPFANFDEMNRARQRLATAGIDAIVIRFQKQGS